MKEYFSHDYAARADENIKKLMFAHSWNGYGLYWGIIESLYNNNGYLDLDYERIAYDMRTQSEIIDSIINDFNLFKIKGKKFYSESVLRRIKLRNEKSEKARESALSRWNKDSNNNANALQTQSDSNANKVKKRKINKSKEKEDIIDKIIDCFQESYFKFFEIDYVITNKGKERSSAGKILSHYKKQYPEAKTDEILMSLSKYFDLCCSINDNWLSQNMSLGLIINKFNEINKILKNGKQSNKGGVSDRQLAEVLANKFGTDRE